MFGENEMGKIKLGRVFGLSILSALSLMAMFVVSAQASEFWVGKTGSFLLATATGAQVGSGKLLVEKRGITITCETGVVTSGALETKTSGKGTAEFSKCTVLNFVDNKELTACSVDQPIKAEATLLPGEHPGAANKRVIAEPVGELFTTVKVTGEACASKGTYPIKGFVSAEITENGKIVNKVVASRTYSELVKDSLSFGAFPAFIDATATVELTGVHKGIAFGVA
jgi:hypothetical protein